MKNAASYREAATGCAPSAPKRRLSSLRDIAMRSCNRAFICSEFRRGIGWAHELELVDQQKVEAVRIRLVTLLGREATARVTPDVSAVEYQLAGLWADLRLDRQRIRISRERFEKHQRPDQVFPPEALFYATNGRSFLLTSDGGIVPHAD